MGNQESGPANSAGEWKVPEINAGILIKSQSMDNLNPNRSPQTPMTPHTARRKGKKNISQTPNPEAELMMLSYADAPNSKVGVESLQNILKLAACESQFVFQPFFFLEHETIDSDTLISLSLKYKIPPKACVGINKKYQIVDTLSCLEEEDLILENSSSGEAKNRSIIFPLHTRIIPLVKNANIQQQDANPQNLIFSDDFVAFSENAGLIIKNYFSPSGKDLILERSSILGCETMFPFTALKGPFLIPLNSAKRVFSDSIKNLFEQKIMIITTKSRKCKLRIAVFCSEIGQKRVKNWLTNAS